jgi:hypothetical protein
VIFADCLETDILTNNPQAMNDISAVSIIPALSATYVSRALDSDFAPKLKAQNIT